MTAVIPVINKSLAQKNIFFPSSFFPSKIDNTISRNAGNTASSMYCSEMNGDGESPLTSVISVTPKQSSGVVYLEHRYTQYTLLKMPRISVYPSKIDSIFRVAQIYSIPARKKI